MRKQKSDKLRCARIQITMPQSFYRYISANLAGASGYIQAKIAEVVLGVSRTEFRQMYAGEPDIRFKPESMKKAYIRAARWILESRVHRIWQKGFSLVFDVEWTITGDRTFCSIELVTGPGFKNVIYDAILKEEPQSAAITPAMIDGILPGSDGFTPARYPIKFKIAERWANYSYCGAEAAND